MKKKVLIEIIKFYAYPENFDDTSKARIARVINSTWGFGIVCEICFKRVKGVSNSIYGKWICKECKARLE